MWGHNLSYDTEKATSPPSYTSPAVFTTSKTASRGGAVVPTRGGFCPSGLRLETFLVVMGGAAAIWRVEVLDAAQPPTLHRAAPTKYSVQNVKSAAVETLVQ